MLRSRGVQRRLDVQLEQAEHLRVAVLLDHVHAVVLLHEIVHFARERIGPQPQIVGLDVVFVAQLVAGLDDRPVRSAVGDDADLRLSRYRPPGAGTKERAVSNLRLRRSMLRSKSSGRSLYCAFSLWPLPRAKYAAAG